MMMTDAVTLTNEAMLELCNLYYDKETFEHAKRVANKARDIARFFGLSYDYYFIYQLGLAHDLYEDTSIKKDTWFDKKFEKNLSLLTREKDVDYNDYIAQIYAMAKNNPEYMPAYIVKLADMYDHLTETDTLTEELKEKYIAAIAYLF